MSSGREQIVIVDGRWLPPPEPMEKVLTALALLRPGQRIRFMIHREPQPLYGILTDMGYRHDTQPLPDGCFEIRIEPR